MLAALATRGRASSDPLRGALAAVAVAACAVLLYLPALGYGFVFDDLSLMTAAGEPVALGGTIPYRPVRYASYLVDWTLGGSAAVYHLHNVLLHALVAALTVVAARRLGADAFAAFAGALVVALHPLAVEAAAYVAGRRDLVCVALGLASLVAWIDRRPRIALALLAGSVGAKESGLVFAIPLLAAALVLVPGARAARSLAAIAITTAGAAAVALLYGAIGPWLPGADVAGAGRTIVHYATGLAGLRVLAPEYPALVPPAGASAAAIAATILALAAVVAATCDGLRARRIGSGRERAFVLVWLTATVASLALWGGVHEPGADRHAYLVLPPLGVAAALLVARVLAATGGKRDAFAPPLAATKQERDALAQPRAATEHERDAFAQPLGAAKQERDALAQPLAAIQRHAAAFAITVRRSSDARRAFTARIALAAGIAALAATASTTTREQMRIWQNERTLWSHAVAQGGASPRAYANLARALAADGDYALARRHLADALAAGGDDGLVYASRAALRCGEGRRALAQRDVRRAHRAGAAPLVQEIARACDLTLRARMHLRKRAVGPLEASGK